MNPELILLSSTPTDGITDVPIEPVPEDDLTGLPDPVVTGDSATGDSATGDSDPSELILLSSTPTDGITDVPIESVPETDALIEPVPEDDPAGLPDPVITGDSVTEDSDPLDSEGVTPSPDGISNSGDTGFEGIPVEPPFVIEEPHFAVVPEGSVQPDLPDDTADSDGVSQNESENEVDDAVDGIAIDDGTSGSPLLAEVNADIESNAEVPISEAEPLDGAETSVIAPLSNSFAEDAQPSSGNAAQSSPMDATDEGTPLSGELIDTGEPIGNTVGDVFNNGSSTEILDVGLDSAGAAAPSEPPLLVPPFLFIVEQPFIEVIPESMPSLGSSVLPVNNGLADGAIASFESSTDPLVSTVTPDTETVI